MAQQQELESKQKVIIQPKATQGHWRIVGHESGWNVQHNTDEMGWLDVGDIFQDFPGVIAGFMAVVGRLLNQTDIGQTAQ